MSDFSINLVHNFSRLMRIRRQNLGWSTQDLTDRTEELGHKISRSALSGLENNRNKDNLSLADAIIICEALSLPLRALLFDNERAMQALEQDSQDSKELLALALFNTAHDQLDNKSPSTQKALS